MTRRFFVVPGLILALCGALVFSSVPVSAQNLSPQERAQLQAEYDELQKEIAEQQKIIAATEAQKNTYKGNVANLDAQIKAAQAQIDAKNIQIKQLSAQIAEKNRTIGQLANRIEAGHASLASLLRQEDQLDDYSAVEVALSASDVSSFFSDLDAFASIETNLAALFSDIRTAKNETETQKATLTDTQSKVADAKYDIQTKQQKVSADQRQQKQLLAITANQEAQYQKVLAANQAKAAAIRAALFPLRDAAAIQFGDALKYAQRAQKATGVDPALVLAILTQESNLGANVGQCYLTNDSAGSGIGKNTGTAFANVMSPTRDVPVFLALASALGFDPHHQVVSCPIASAGGWGGAMGPAQFIPSTWQLYAGRIASARGEAVANPWSAQDAIMAMSFLLSDNGAGAGGYTAEYNAAARYYAGWNGPSTAAGRSYGAQVMAKVASLQQNIDFLANN